MWGLIEELLYLKSIPRKYLSIPAWNSILDTLSIVFFTSFILLHRRASKFRTNRIMNSERASNFLLPATHILHNILNMASAPAIRTRITSLFGCKYPLVLPGMSWISDPKLVAAVSNAGKRRFWATWHFFCTMCNDLPHGF